MGQQSVWKRTPVWGSRPFAAGPRQLRGFVRERGGRAGWEELRGCLGGEAEHNMAPHTHMRRLSTYFMPTVSKINSDPRLNITESNITLFAIFISMAIICMAH